MKKEVKEKLKKDLDPKAIKTRETDYGTIDYIKSNYAISQANEIFNFDGWAGQIVDLEKLGESSFEKKGKTYYHVMFKCIYQITVDSSARQDVGFGNSTQGNKGSATETAIKSAVSDGIKRTLRHFGNQFGLSLYSEHQETKKSNNKTTSQNKVVVAKDEIQDKIQKNIDKYGTEKEISNKVHGVLKGYFSDIGVKKEDKQHEILGELTGEDIDSIYDLSYSHISPITEIIFSDKKDQLTNLVLGDSEENTDSTFDLIDNVKDKLDKQNISNRQFIDWISDKANNDYNKFDEIPESWLKQVTKNSFWEKNKDDIEKFGKSDLIKGVESIIDQVGVKPSQLWTWFSKDYESLKDIPTNDLKKATSDKFWDKNLKEIDETIPF